MPRLAASLADQAPVCLGDAVTGITDRNVNLPVLACALSAAPFVASTDVTAQRTLAAQELRP